METVIEFLRSGNTTTKIICLRLFGATSVLQNINQNFDTKIYSQLLDCFFHLLNSA